MVRIVAGLLCFDYPVPEDRAFLDRVKWDDLNRQRITLQKIKDCIAESDIIRGYFASRNLIRMADEHVYPQWIQKTGANVCRIIGLRTTNNQPLLRPTYWFTLVNPTPEFDFYDTKKSGNLDKWVSEFITDFIKDLTRTESVSAVAATGAGKISSNLCPQPFSQSKDALERLRSMAQSVFSPPPIDLQEACRIEPSQFKSQICILFQAILSFLNWRQIVSPQIQSMKDRSLSILAYFVFFGLDMLHSYPDSTPESTMIRSIGKDENTVSSVVRAWLGLVVSWILPPLTTADTLQSPYEMLLSIHPESSQIMKTIVSKIFDESFPNKQTWEKRFYETAPCVIDKILNPYVVKECHRLSSGGIFRLKGSTILDWCTTAIRAQQVQFLNCLNENQNDPDRLFLEEEDWAETWSIMAVLGFLILF